MHHNTTDNSTCRNDVDLSLNKTIDNSTRTVTNNFNQASPDTLPNHPSATFNLNRASPDSLPIQEPIDSLITKLSDAPLHSLLEGCEHLLQRLVDQPADRRVSHCSESLQTHSSSLRHSLRSARGTLWDHAQQLSEISDRNDPVVAIDRLLTEFTEAVRSDGVQILKATHRAYLSLTTRYDDESSEIGRAETFADLFEEYVTWHKNVKILQEAIQAEERRLGDLYIQDALESAFQQARGGARASMEDLWDMTEVELRRRWVRSKL